MVCNESYQYSFYYVYDCFKPELKKFEFDFNYQPNCWDIRINTHGKIELWASHYEKGIVLIEEDNTNIYFNKSIDDD